MALPFPTSYKKTIIYDLHVLRILDHFCYLYDVASDVTWREPDIVNMIFKDIDAAFITVDAGSKTSLIDADKWVKLLFKLNIPTHKITLLVNKADVPSPVVNQNTLDTFVALGGCSSWFWTVGHERFKDYCPSRGRMENQEPPLDILIRKVRELISQNQKYMRSTSVVLDAEETKQTKTVDKCRRYRARSDRYLNDETHDKNFSDEGWNFFAGVLSRQQAHEILKDRIPGSFLIRRSDLNYSIRIVVKREDGTYAHIPISSRNGKYIVGQTNDGNAIHNHASSFPGDKGRLNINETMHTTTTTAAAATSSSIELVNAANRGTGEKSSGFNSESTVPMSNPAPMHHQSHQLQHKRGSMYDSLLDVVESIGLNIIEGIRFEQKYHF